MRTGAKKDERPDRGFCGPAPRVGGVKRKMQKIEVFCYRVVEGVGRDKVDSDVKESVVGSFVGIDFV